MRVETNSCCLPILRLRGPMTTVELHEYIGGLPNICVLKRSSPRACRERERLPGRVRYRLWPRAERIQQCPPHAPAADSGRRTRLGHRLGDQQSPVYAGLRERRSPLQRGIFAWCYKRMDEFIPQLIHEGKQPRVMLDYSGCLLHGLRTMGLDDVIDSLRNITCNPAYRRAVEWLGNSWATR